MHFNQEGSVVWEDAKTLLEVFEKTWATKTSLRKSATLILKRGPRPPPPASSPGPIASTSTSTDPSTQRASGSGTKSESKSVSIKLSPSAPKRERTREVSSVPKREKSSTPAIGTVGVAMDADEDEDGGKGKGVKEDVASVPTDQLVAYTESKMEIWSGPSTSSSSSAASGSNHTAAGWMAAPKVRILKNPSYAYSIRLRRLTMLV